MLNFYRLCFDLVFMLLEQGATFVQDFYFILSRVNVATSLSKIQDRIQIFFAFLFWMFLKVPRACNGFTIFLDKTI